MKEGNVTNDIRINSFLTEDETAVLLHVFVSTDGFKFINSSGIRLYPLWIALADLPPVFRSVFQKIIRVTLWFGEGKPGFDMIFQYVQQEIKNPTFVQYEALSYKAFFDFFSLSADIPMKTAVLNMKQFNRYYDCHLCEDRGEFGGKDSVSILPTGI